MQGTQPDRPPPKVWVARNECDGVLADFARCVTAVAGQRFLMSRDYNPATAALDSASSAQPPALYKRLERACPRSVQTPMLGLTITRRRALWSE